MKKVITVTFLESSKLNCFISDQIAEYNAGRIVIDKYGFASCVAMYGLPFGLSVDFKFDGDNVLITENKTPIATLEFKEVHELTETEADLVIQEKLS